MLSERQLAGAELLAGRLWMLFQAQLGGGMCAFFPFLNIGLLLLVYVSK